MNKAIILENISRQLDLIIEQNNSIKSNVGKIPQINIDILKANICKLYEQYCDLEKVNLQLTSDYVKKEKEEIPAVIDEIKETVENPLLIVHETPIKEEKQIIPEKPQSLVVDENIEIVFTPEPKAIIEEKALEIREENTLEVREETTIQIIEETFIEEKSLSTIKSETLIDLFGNTATTTIADKYKGEATSLNERMQKNKPDKSISSKMQHHAIKDLKSAIGINEKFLFINELFKGNMKEYNESILKLNNFKLYSEAEELLEELKNKYKWEDDLVALLALKDFVERKFI